MAEILLEREILAYGPATTVSTVLANVPIKPRSVKIFIDNGSVAINTAYDDGMGNIVGVGISGKVVYATGEISLTTIPALTSSTHSVYASYTYFYLGVTELNKVQYSSQDFLSNVEALKEFIRTYYPEDYNDYQNSSMGMSLIDINAYADSNLAWYLNRRMTDLYFPTAKSPSAVAKVAQMLGYKAKGAYASQVNLVVQLKDGPYAYPISIEKPFAFQGPNGLTFEYRNTVPVTFNAGEVTKSFDVMEGISTVDNFVSNGETNQVFRLVKIPEGSFVEEGSIVVKVNGEQWTEYPIIPFRNEKAFEANIVTYPPTVKFGDGIKGQIPPEGYGIEISYVITKGFAGRISKESITAPVVPLNVNFNAIDLTVLQPYASVGGDNPEDLRSITVNAPLFQKTQDRALTKSDYDFIGNTFPNVARSDAQIVRTVSQDYILQDFFTELSKNIITLRNSDRYLSPRPQVNRVYLSSELFSGTEVSLKIGSNTYSQEFDTDHYTTLTALAVKVGADSKVENVTVNSLSNDMIITGKAETVFTVSDLLVTTSTAPVVSIVETSSAPNQVQNISFDKDFFTGNVVTAGYEGVDVDVLFDTNSSTTLNKVANTYANFAKAPTIAVKETAGAPSQKTKLTFSKALFKGCNTKILVTDLGQTDLAETELNIPFRTDSATTILDVKSALEALSFVRTATASGLEIEVQTESSKVQEIADEVLAYGDGSKISFPVLAAVNTPVRTFSVVITAGSITGTDVSVAGTISGTGISGGIDYNSGIINLTFATAPALGTPIKISYMYESSSRTLSFGECTVSVNTVTVDETTRTITVATDGADSLVLSASVSGRAAPSINQTLLQEMISEDMGSVSGIGDSLKTGMDTVYSYLDKALSDGCRANTVVVSVLSKNADKKYAAPTQSIMDDLWMYLDERKDIVHFVEVTSGIDKVIDVDVDIEVLVNANSIEDEVVKKIERAILRSDASPYGLLVEREFNLSLYVSDFFREIKRYVQDSEIDHLNVVIKGPAKHSSGLVSDEILALGIGGASPLVVDKVFAKSPCVAGDVKIYVDGIIVGEDDGTGLIQTVSGAGYTCVGQIDYTSSHAQFEINPNPPVDDPVTVTYYASKIDKRGNYICPKGHVLQAGTVIIRPLPRV